MVSLLRIIMDPFLTERSVGDVLSLRVFGQVIVILNTSKATKDLLEKRGDNYSDRPVIPFFDMYVHAEFVRAVSTDFG